MHGNMNVKLIQANLVEAYTYATTNSFLVLVYCVIRFSVLCQKVSVAKRPFMKHEPLLGGNRTTFQTFTRIMATESVLGIAQ
jgi:hypothetical protein